MADNGAQKLSRSYLLAVEDQEFLLRDEMRPFRFGMEYAKAEYALRDWGVRSTVVVFGSARTPSAEQAAAQAKKARGAAEKRAAQKALDRYRFYEDARAFARIVSMRGGALAARSGISEAAWRPVTSAITRACSSTRLMVSAPRASHSRPGGVVW